MKIVADEAIPFIKNYFSHVGQLVLKPGRLIIREDLIDSDILLVRSVTPVNENLLRGTAVKFVGSVTTGIDHLDTSWLDQAHISWQAATGYNAIPVSDYVVAVIAALSKQKTINSVGIIGVGYIGSHIAERLKNLGFTVVLNDPLRAENEPQFNSTLLSELCSLDAITIHVPLTFHSKYPTYHLIGHEFLQDFEENSVLINSSRGSVIDFNAFKFSHHRWYTCLDVWEGEPNIDAQMLAAAVVATPHLAGYSVQSRYRGINMIYQHLCTMGWIKDKELFPPKLLHRELNFNGQKLSWQDIVLAIFDPLAITQKMKMILLKEPEKCATLFDQLRGRFIGDNIQRHEFGFTTVSEVRLKEEDRYCLTQLGINIKDKKL